MAFCKSCGNEVDGVKFCGKCGTPVENKIENVAPVQPVQSVQTVQPMYNQSVNALPKDGYGIAGFICGIVGITACCGITSIPGLICSIISMNKVKKGEVDPSTKWMGTVGLVLSIVGLLLILFVIAYYFLVFYVAINDPSYYA